MTNAYKDLGQYKRAIEDYDQAIRLDPKYAYAYYNRGNAYKKIGQHANVADDYNKYLQIHGNKDGDADKIRRMIRELGHKPRY
jgi:tetratricopeptide (TPR) repeat protein